MLMIDSLLIGGSASRVASASCLGAHHLFERRRREDYGALIRDAGPPLPRNCAFFCCEPVTSDAAGVQVRSLRRLDAEPDAPAGRSAGGATAPGSSRRGALAYGPFAAAGLS